MDTKEQTKERVKRYRERQRALQGGEDVTQDVTQDKRMSWEEQQKRFPDIPLPFGDAYYKALKEQEDKGGNDDSNHKG